MQEITKGGSSSSISKQADVRRHTVFQQQVKLLASDLASEVKPSPIPVVKRNQDVSPLHC